MRAGETRHFLFITSKYSFWHFSSLSLDTFSHVACRHRLLSLSTHIWAISNSQMPFKKSLVNIKFPDTIKWVVCSGKFSKGFPFRGKNYSEFCHSCNSPCDYSWTHSLSLFPLTSLARCNSFDVDGKGFLYEIFPVAPFLPHHFVSKEREKARVCRLCGWLKIIFHFHTKFICFTHRIHRCPFISESVRTHHSLPIVCCVVWAKTRN